MHRYPQNDRREDAYFRVGVKCEIINTDPYSDAECLITRNVRPQLSRDRLSTARIRNFGKIAVWDFFVSEEKWGEHWTS